MLKRSICVAGLLAVLPISSCMAAENSAANCMDGRVQLLQRDGFTGPIICEPSAAQFRKIGTISTGGHSYLLYDFRYSFKPELGNVRHGGQRLLVFSDDKRYLGQYALSPPPHYDLAIEGTRVNASADGKSLGFLDFRNGPPNFEDIDGYHGEFFK